MIDNPMCSFFFFLLVCRASLSPGQCFWCNILKNMKPQNTFEPRGSAAGGIAGRKRPGYLVLPPIGRACHPSAPVRRRMAPSPRHGTSRFVTNG